MNAKEIIAALLEAKNTPSWKQFKKDVIDGLICALGGEGLKVNHRNMWASTMQVEGSYGPLRFRAAMAEVDSQELESEEEIVQGKRVDVPVGVYAFLDGGGDPGAIAQAEGLVMASDDGYGLIEISHEDMVDVIRGCGTAMLNKMQKNLEKVINSGKYPLHQGTKEFVSFAHSVIGVGLTPDTMVKLIDPDPTK